jgi:hypothetical protein
VKSAVKRDNHYEAAFEAFLRSRKVPFIAIDEAKRTLLGDEKVKSLDFIIVGPEDAKLVVDVKGRRYPGGTAEKPKKTWQNWATLEDIDGLDRWAAQLGHGFRGVIAFAYHIAPPFVLPENTTDAFAFHDDTYLMRAISSVEYRKHMTTRSPRWGTVGLPAKAFRTLVKPFTAHLQRAG